MKNYPLIAVDPGTSGGIAFRDYAGKITLFAMPETEGDIKAIFDEAEVEHTFGECPVFIEEVGGFIKGNPAPGSAMFNFGRNFGFILGLCSGLEFPVHLVRPQRWQKELGIPARGTASAPEHKRNLKAEAQRRHPELKITLKTCDALLILDWASIDKKGVKP